MPPSLGLSPATLATALRRPQGKFDSAWYKFGRGWLCVDSDDEPLIRRFREIYSEGAVQAPEPVTESLSIRCTVRSLAEPGVAVIAFDDPQPLDAVGFCSTLFRDRDYLPGPPADAGWCAIATRESPHDPLIAIKDHYAVADTRQPWQPFIANYAINRTLRLQPEMVFFHAGSVDIAGRGVLLMGPKGCGKTTTSTTLASRGHPFLGDEIAGVCTRTLEMLPFRRAVSIREGVRAPRVNERLASTEHPVERFPDGSARILARIGEMFPGEQCTSTRLSAAFFLRRFEPQAAAERFSFGVEHFGLLTPLACSMWGVSAGLRMLEFTRIFGALPCYFLHPGPPDETADLVEHVMKGLIN